MSQIIKEIRGLFFAFCLALFVRTFVFQPFHIPSGSMYPTLMVGDYLFVTKYTYGWSQYSLPFAPPLFRGRVGEIRTPRRGEVVVFTNPKDPSLDYIKRLVGLPGDRIQVKEGVLHINETPVTLERIADYVMVDTETHRVRSIPQYKETLPEGASYTILKEDSFGAGALDNTPVYVVPEGHYFMMGDNRDHSQDSRVLEKVGYIPSTYLVGPAQMIFFSTEAKWHQVTEWASGVRGHRLMTAIQ